MMRTARVGWLLALVWACMSVGASGATMPPGKRFALVIGNSDYPGPSIPGRADAEAVAKALDGLGFTVVGGSASQEALVDAGFSAMTDGLKALEQAIKDSGEVPGVVLFYFSGHGFQVDGASYLLPARTLEITDLKNQAISVEDVVNSYLVVGDVFPNFAAKIVILDACRSNKELRLNGQPVPPGLARRQFQTPPRTMLFYATDYGVPADGTAISGHSPFTHEILLYLGAAGYELRDFVSRVVEGTQNHTRPRQTPQDDGSGRVLKPFFFRPAVEVKVSITDSDDGVFVVSGDNTASQWKDDPPVSSTFFLHSGENRLSIHVFNQKTYYQTHSWEHPEGWHYNVVVSIPGQLPQTFTDGEAVVRKDGPRFGRIFEVVTAVLNVNPISAEVSLDDVHQFKVPPEEREDIVLFQRPIPALGKTFKIGGREELRGGVNRCITVGSRVDELFRQLLDALIHGKSLDDPIRRFNDDFTKCVGGPVWMEIE
jgi:hypothetical protein